MKTSIRLISVTHPQEDFLTQYWIIEKTHIKIPAQISHQIDEALLQQPMTHSKAAVEKKIHLNHSDEITWTNRNGK